MLRTALLALLAAAQSAPPSPSRPATPSDIVAAAPAADWREVRAEDVLMVTLAGGREVAIELAGDFAPVHVANIRALARSPFWRGASVYRVQDNYVAQWGLRDGTPRPTLPRGVVAKPPAEYEKRVPRTALAPLGFPDPYASAAGYLHGFPANWDAASGAAALAHCYGTVGVGRGGPPDTGDGTELYAVIGHGPRHLDRNIAVVGRVVGGIEHLSSLPRGTEALGFYKEPAQDTAVQRVAIAADLPAARRPRFEVLRPESASFRRWLQARANRKDDFFIRPAGGVDLCNAQPPVRRAEPRRAEPLG